MNEKKKPDELEQVIAEEDEDEDWGEVEQKAYERLQEDGVKNIPGEEVLQWLSMVEIGRAHV